MTDDEFDHRTMEELQDWQPSDRPCPQCGKPTMTGNWFDDHPNNGGANIGTLAKCTDDACDYFESF